MSAWRSNRRTRRQSCWPTPSRNTTPDKLCPERKRRNNRMSFPIHRPRRLRRTPAIRKLVRETRLTTGGLVYPMFATPGTKVRNEISSMPGIYQQSVDQIVEECREVAGAGIPGVILFGLPEKKDEVASEASSPDGAVQRAVRAIRKAKLDLIVITDVCLCEYTSHGHCGMIKDGEVLNDPQPENPGGCSAIPRRRRCRHRSSPSDMMGWCAADPADSNAT